MRAPVAEVLSSVQGEGPLVGVRQMFVRTYGCDLRCTYCDTPASRVETGPCRFEKTPGGETCSDVENPVEAGRIVQYLAGLGPRLGSHHSVSLTGGEPLLHAGFVGEVAAGARQLGLRAYLETNGQRVAELETVVDVIDIIAMDVKLPSSQAAEAAFSPEAFLANSRAFLRIAQRREVFVKVVCAADTEDAEVVDVARRMAEESRDVLLVLQPATPRYRGEGAVGPARLLCLQELAARHLTDVRVIPQCHRVMGVR